MADRFDAVVIGTGQSGPALATRLAKAGRRVAIVERDLVGGTCVNVGCTPTKTLVASARVAHLVRRAADWGVLAGGEPRVDWPAVRARKDAIVASSREGVTKWLQSSDGVELIRGHARFAAPDRVRVGDRELTADRIFVNVGTRATVPPMPGLDSVPYLTNASLMELDELPSHLLIVGGSYVGIEFAQMFRRFGSRVTLIEKGPRLIGREDEAVSDEVRRILEGEGVEVVTGAECLSARRDGDGIAIGIECEDGDSARGSHLLLAVGRTPNTDDLGVEDAGLKLDERGHLEVDERLRTNVAGIWAIGDVNGRGAFTHTSWNDYEIVAANLLDGADRSVEDRIMAYALYTDPPLGRIGMTESQARASGRPLLAARMPMSRVGRARERGETEGFMQVVVDAQSERILGAAILGIEGDEAIHVFASTMYADAPYTTLRDAMHIHPTVSELIPTLLGELKPLDRSDG